MLSLLRSCLISETFSVIITAEIPTGKHVLSGINMWIWEGAIRVMLYDLFTLSLDRRVTLCGTNYYPNPTIHVDRVMQEHDLMYIYDGQWQVNQDGINHHMVSGDAMLLRAGSHHFGTAACTPNMRNMFVHFNRLPGDRGAVELTPEEARMHAAGNRLCIPTVIHCGQESNVNATLREIIGV